MNIKHLLIFFLVQSGPGAIDIIGSTTCLENKTSNSIGTIVLDTQTSKSDAGYIQKTMSKSEYVVSLYFSNVLSTEFNSLAYTVHLNPSLDKRLEKSTYLNLVSIEREPNGNLLAISKVMDGSTVHSNILSEKADYKLFSNHLYVYPKNSKIQVLVTAGSLLV